MTPSELDIQLEWKIIQSLREVNKKKIRRIMEEYIKKLCDKCKHINTQRK